jgi:hypothetical protein
MVKIDAQAMVFAFLYLLALGTAIDLATRIMWAALKWMLIPRKRQPPLDDRLASQVAKEFATKYIQTQDVPEAAKELAAQAHAAFLHHVMVEYAYRVTAG